MGDRQEYTCMHVYIYIYVQAHAGMESNKSFCFWVEDGGGQAILPALASPNALLSLLPPSTTCCLRKFLLIQPCCFLSLSPVHLLLCQHFFHFPSMKVWLLLPLVLLWSDTIFFQPDSQWSPPACPYPCHHQLSTSTSTSPVSLAFTTPLYSCPAWMWSSDMVWRD